MAFRRRQRRLLPDHSNRHAPNNMEQLTLKYMEMCKMESSTDSDSEISQRWSDTSTMGCVSSAPVSVTSRRAMLLTHKPAARHGCHSLFLDPYDGSSEDSDESHINAGVSSRQTRQQGKGCRLLSRSRRFVLHHPASVALRDGVKNGIKDFTAENQHLSDVQMKCRSDSELWVCELDTLPPHSDLEGFRKEERINDSITQTMDVELQLDDSGLHATRSSSSHTPVKESSPPVLDSSSERSLSSCNLRSLSKRKLALPGAEAVELGQRKRQCVVSMEDEQERKNSAS